MRESTSRKYASGLRPLRVAPLDNQKEKRMLLLEAKG